MWADAGRFMAALLAALRRGEPRPEPFTIAGDLTVRWDGTSCRLGEVPTAPGTARMSVVNESSAPVSVALAGLEAPHAWAEALAFVDTVDLTDATLVAPDWLIEVGGLATAEAGKTSTAFVTLPPAEIGALCLSGDWPAVEFHDGGSFTIGN